ncbi:MAG TPA: aldo/keto reductase [Acholeplasmataceae bacterium]|jgi:predicted aldo/keto reductase-like oxidoreductase|nr:aldo/keto reductase [Acholeplasmataceae bacterium]
MRRLGKTNLYVNEVGFGGIPIQRVDENTVRKIIDELINQGINFIDTARGYTVSEEYLGKALENRREKFILATKSMARTYQGMKEDIEISLKNLNTSYIDLYQCHNVPYGENLDGAIKALLEAKEEGKIKHIGITSHSYEFLDELLDRNTIFETIQFPYNFIETKAEKLFAKAYEKEIGVICMKPLAGGALDNAKVALKYILNNPHVSVVIPGMASPEEVKINGSVKSGEYNDEELKYIEETRKVLDEDFCRRCGYCLPCTVGINIPGAFLFEGYYNRYNLKEWAVSRFKTLQVRPEECIECGECESRCPYNLKIIQKLKKVAETFKGI